MNQVEFIDACLADPERFLAADARIQAAFADHPLYQTEAAERIPLCTTPFFLGRAELQRIEELASALFGALAAATAAVCSTADYGEALAHHAVFAEANRTPRRFAEPLYSARLDVMLDRNREPHVLEFNTSCPAGMCFMTAWRRLILSHTPFGAFGEQIGRFGYDDPTTFLRGMAEITQASYGRTAPLRFALVNDSAGLTLELPLMVRLLRELGHHADIHPLRALAYDGTRLLDPQGRAIDAVYCKIRPTPSILRGWDQAERAAYSAFLAACAHDRVAVFNPFPAMTVGEDKAMLAYLRAGRFDEQLDARQREAVARWLPPTWALDEDVLRREPELLAHPEDYVLKPRMESRGRFVRFGRDDPQTWAEALAERCDGQWVVQRVVDVLTQAVPTTGADGQLELQTITQCLGVFVLRGRVMGVVSRVSPHEVQNIGRGGAVQAVVIDD
jgi:Glutathionylspermidine synthase preATP-grasp